MLKFETMLVLNKLVKLEKNYKSVFKISELYVLCCKIALAASIDGDFDNFHTIKMTYLKHPVIPHPFLLYIGSHELRYVGRDSSISKLTVTMPRGPLL